MRTGEIRAKVRIENEWDLSLLKEKKLSKKDVRAAEIDAIVDTGAVMTLLPRDVVERLGLPIYGKTAVLLADDRRATFDRAGAFTLSIGGRAMKTDCLVGRPGSTPLVGQLVMEALDLIADPKRRTLRPRLKRITLRG